MSSSVRSSVCNNFHARPYDRPVRRASVSMQFDLTLQYNGTLLFAPLIVKAYYEGAIKIIVISFMPCSVFNLRVNIAYVSDGSRAVSVKAI